MNVYECFTSPAQFFCPIYLRRWPGLYHTPPPGLFTDNLMPYTWSKEQNTVWDCSSMFISGIVHLKCKTAYQVKKEYMFQKYRTAPPHVAPGLFTELVLDPAAPRPHHCSDAGSQPTTRGRESLSNFPSSHKRVPKQLLSWRPRCVVCDSTPSPPISLFNLLSTSDSSRETHMCTT